MPSDTDLCNDALGQIGAQRITGLDDGSTNANHCTVFYPALRDAALTMTHWRFNRQRIELAQDASPPAFVFAFSYTLPGDCLKVIEYNGANLDTSNLSLFESAAVYRWKIEQGKLLTNDGVVKIVYLKRLTNPTDFPGFVYQGIASLLAAKLASAIMKHDGMARSKREEGLSYLSLAAAIDGQQGSIEPQISDSLLWGR